MRARWQAVTSRIQRLFHLVVLFCVLRFVVGIGMIVLFDRGAVAWSWQLSLIVGAALIIPVVVALAVRAWSPPYRPAD